MALTKRQREILDYLSGYSEDNGYAPSFEEIARKFNYNSLATVHEHLSNLERKGYIKRSYNESRAIEILPSDVFPKAVELPLLGTVAAGMPIEAVTSHETMCVPDSFISRGGNHYVLRVRGNSMIDEQIRDGDFVVVEDRKSADSGEMVIALLRGSDVTLKKFYRDPGGKIRLQPANAAMQPIFVDPDLVQIQGVVVGVMRKY
jgi:repressor LexA